MKIHHRRAMPVTTELTRWAERCNYALVLLLLTAVCGCSHGPSAKGPVLISFADRQRARIEPAVSGTTYGSITDRLASLPEEVFAGQDIALSEVVINEGLPGKGVRLIVGGTAVEEGMLVRPEQLAVKGVFDDKKKGSFEENAHLETDAKGDWVAILPDLPYGSQLEVNLTTRAHHGGNGQLRLFVQPLDKFGTSSVAVEHNYKILDERDPADIQVPTD